MYPFIAEVEMMLLMRYKLDPWTLEASMSILDMQFYVKTLTKKIEDENQKSDQNGNKLMKSLRAIRDILNFMFAKESPK